MFSWKLFVMIIVTSFTIPPYRVDVYFREAVVACALL